MFRNLKNVSQEIKDLKSSRNHLKNEVIRIKSELENLQRKLDTTFQFFEIRVDQIYRNLDQGTNSRESANDKSAMLQLPTNPEWEKLIFASRSSHLEPGMIVSPITLSGMRIDTRYALEKMYYTEILGENSGIAVFGPYRRLHVGDYRLELAIEPVEPQTEIALFLEVFTICDGEEVQIAARIIEIAEDTRLDFTWDVAFIGCEVQFRIHQRGGDAVRLFGMDLMRA